ncbi:MAG TPA: zf-HC2 domain-containing protein, partial [Gemmatimonadota bacterium]|nr:zf-HC2 domain-containing protein [Gemmatimonadota bacterium]
MAEQLNCEAIIDAGLIEQYLAGMLSEAEIEAFESHYLTCDRCQNELRLAATIKDALPELLHEQAVVAGATETDTDRRWLGRRKRIGAVAVAIAAALAGLLLIQPADVENLE